MFEMYVHVLLDLIPFKVLNKCLQLLKIMDPLIRACEGLVPDQIIVVFISLLESNNSIQ